MTVWLNRDVSNTNLKSGQPGEMHGRDVFTFVYGQIPTAFSHLFPYRPGAPTTASAVQDVGEQPSHQAKYVFLI